MRQVSGFAHPKINLTLDILDRRPDGYHDIRSIMQTIGLFEEFSFLRRDDEPGIHLKVDGPFAADIPVGNDNIVVRAAHLALVEAGVAPDSIGLQIYLEKCIPVQAGLGGGSSDAAAGLILTNILFDLKLPKDLLLRLAAQLGSDVPYFMTGGTCLVEGRGERVTKLDPQWKSAPNCQFLVLCKPATNVSTAAAYAALDRAREGGGHRAADSTGMWLDRFAAGESDLPLSNDFQSVIFDLNPEIANAASMMEQARGPGDGRPVLCGSGASIFMLAASVKSAMQIQAKLRDTVNGWVQVTQTFSSPLTIGAG